MVSSALKTLFAVAEAYPDLKANKNFMILQEELSGTEGKIAYARQFYNDNVMRFNTAIQRFPASILASLFKFKQKDYFEVQGKEKEPVSVEF
jgi:LemA protein